MSMSTHYVNPCSELITPEAITLNIFTQMFLNLKLRDTTNANKAIISNRIYNNPLIYYNVLFQTCITITTSIQAEKKMLNGLDEQLLKFKKQKEDIEKKIHLTKTKMEDNMKTRLEPLDDQIEKLRQQIEEEQKKLDDFKNTGLQTANTAKTQVNDVKTQMEEMTTGAKKQMDGATERVTEMTADATKQMTTGATNQVLDSKKQMNGAIDEMKTGATNRVNGLTAGAKNRVTRMTAGAIDEMKGGSDLTILTTSLTELNKKVSYIKKSVEGEINEAINPFKKALKFADYSIKAIEKIEQQSKNPKLPVIAKKMLNNFGLGDVFEKEFPKIKQECEEGKECEKVVSDSLAAIIISEASNVLNINDNELNQLGGKKMSKNRKINKRKYVGKSKTRNKRK